MGIVVDDEHDAGELWKGAHFLCFAIYGRSLWLRYIFLAQLWDNGAGMSWRSQFQVLQTPVFLLSTIHGSDIDIAFQFVTSIYDVFDTFYGEFALGWAQLNPPTLLGIEYWIQ